MQLRKIIKARGHFPTDEAATKLLYLALRNLMTKWRRSDHAWYAAIPHLALLVRECFTTPNHPRTRLTHKNPYTSSVYLTF